MPVDPNRARWPGQGRVGSAERVRDQATTSADRRRPAAPARPRRRTSGFGRRRRRPGARYATGPCAEGGLACEGLRDGGDRGPRVLIVLLMAGAGDPRVAAFVRRRQRAWWCCPLVGGSFPRAEVATQPDGVHGFRANERWHLRHRDARWETGAGPGGLASPLAEMQRQLAGDEQRGCSPVPEGSPQQTTAQHGRI